MNLLQIYGTGVRIEADLKITSECDKVREKFEFTEIACLDFVHEKNPLFRISATRYFGSTKLIEKKV